MFPIIPGFAAATSLLVLPEGTGPYPTLQAALSVAADGDTILLGNGIFSGAENHNLQLENMSLTIRSQSGDPLACQVDVGGSTPQSGRFLLCSGGPDHEVTVEGLTLRNGFSYQPGGSVSSMGLHLLLRDCRLLDNFCDGYEIGGGAVVQAGGSLTLEDCLFQNNESHALPGQGPSGGAVSCYEAEVIIQDCHFVGNFAPGAFDSGGEGGAIYVTGGSLQLDNSEFLSNSVGGSIMASSYGGAI